MSSIDTLERRVNTNGSAKRQRGAVQRHKDVPSSEQIDAVPVAVSPAASQREREQSIESAPAELRESPYYVIRRVSCEVCVRVLTLRGRVSSYYMKQMAQTVVRHPLEGEMVLNNQFELDRT